MIAALFYIGIIILAAGIAFGAFAVFAVIAGAVGEKRMKDVLNKKDGK